jgi:DNA-binding transcriptional LysR family regulator
MVLDALDAAARRAQIAANAPRLVLAVKPGVGSGLLPGLLDAYDQTTAAVSIDVVFTHDQPAALRNGTADAAVVCGGEDLSGLHTVELTEERPVVLLRAGHALTRRQAVTFGEIRQLESFEAACPAVGLDEIIELVALGRLVVVVGESAGGHLGQMVAAVPISDMPGTVLEFAWSQQEPTPQLAGLIATATTFGTLPALHPKAS